MVRAWLGSAEAERLKALPLVDTVGISLKLDNLMALAATLPLAIPDSTATGAPAARDTRAADANENIAMRFGRGRRREAVVEPACEAVGRAAFRVVCWQ